MTQRHVIVAAAQYEVGFLKSWADFQEKVTACIKGAAQKKAQLLVLPEYFSMELASLLGEAIYSKLDKQLAGLQTLLPDFLKLFSDLARQYGLYIQAGSFPVLVDGFYVNRAYFFWPDGRYDFQDKLTMTRFENEQWGIRAGQTVKVFETPFARIGISICYDVEFPLIARQQAERGATLILAPSCTDSEAGYHRVKIGAAARALENQLYVVQAPTVGNCLWSPAIDVNIGKAGIFTPVDQDFPADGVMAMGSFNQAGWVIGALDFAKLDAVRQNGQTLNYRDWKHIN